MKFEPEEKTEWMPTPQQVFYLILELVLFILIFAILAENIAGFSDFYISELPFIGSLFELIAPEATPGHITAALLAFMIVAYPLFIWTYILSNQIFENPQEWFSIAQNQVIASVAVLVLILVASIESLSLFTLISKSGADQGVFVQAEIDEFISALADNKALAIASSVSLTILNLLLALLTAISFQAKD